ncbi:putative tetratricopeptide-like helical domain-containing protein [Rosa chinensis]|uniref:Putative tetratricopeptide-like helical domain-containing protein n=1 Tax=Rosa chinensis TaxID=74649 RepID=A0A2P6PA68_ROSCH|nr:uncharacterized protein LOC112180719 [Rosa chinensis]PRQ18812.1 putative tetratricopeptide-like helical domain-containing protein [Rosa chinensis]
MKSSALIRTGSIGLSGSPAVSGSPRVSLSRTDSLSGAEKSTVAASLRVCLHFDVNRSRDKNTIRRAVSESNILRPDSGKERYIPSGSRSRSPGSGIPEEEMGSKKVTIEREERRKMGEYYQAMLKSNPSDPLLLRNYGQFLHEVEKDMVRAEEYYCRAILASPGDGELLSLYGKLIWESQRDKDRANSYFDQAVSASPNNCMVLGSFASFMWEVEEDEEDDEEINSNSTTAQVSSAAQLVPAF